MARGRRIALMGRLHVLEARGNAGDALFARDDDYRGYLNHWREVVREHLCTVSAWCLMRGALRLVVEPNELPLAQLVQRVHGAHARTVNMARQRTGHLFEGRFTSLVIPNESLDDAVRWVHLWPVRQGRVRRPETYPWSSHRCYVGRGDPYGDVVDAWRILARYGDTLPAAQRAFARFVEADALGADVLPVARVAPGVGGDVAFARAALSEAGAAWRGRRRPALHTLAQRVALLMNVHMDDLTTSARQQDLVMARRLMATVAVRHAGRSVTEVATFLARDKGQVSRLVAQGMSQVRNDEGFRALFDAMRQRGGEAPAKR